MLLLAFVCVLPLGINCDFFSFSIIICFCAIAYLQACQEPVKGFLAFFVSLVYPSMLQYLAEYQGNFFVKDFHYVIAGNLGVLGQKFFHPVGVFLNRFIGADVVAIDDCVRQGFHFVFQPCGKHGQAHYLNQADIFFLDVVQLSMGMVYAEGVL